MSQAYREIPRRTDAAAVAAPTAAAAVAWHPEEPKNT